jgi:hypothetical protein
MGGRDEWEGLVGGIGGRDWWERWVGEMGGMDVWKDVSNRSIEVDRFQNE